MATSAPSSHAPAGVPVTSATGRNETPGTGTPPIRSLGRRRALPGGRAVVGGLLVTLAALGTFVAYTSANTGPTGTVVVADHPLTAGQTIHPADLRSVPAELPDAVGDTLFASPTELEGAVALTPIASDQMIARSAVSTSPGRDRPRTRDLSFALERDRALNGRIQPGELIDLVATFGTGADASTEIVSRQVRIVAVDVPTGAGAGASAKVTITVALEDEDQVLRAANALEVAHVTLIRSTGVDPASHPADAFIASDHAGTTSGTAPGGAP